MNLAHTIDISAAEIDQHCIGSKWTVTDIDRLAKIVSIVAMGQAFQAERIIKKYAPAEPAFTTAELIQDSIRMLTAQKPDLAKGTGYPLVQRDGFIFEIISWIAARQECGDNGVLKSPHIKPTTQGLDGLQLDLNESKDQLTRAIIFEDKCSENPRDTFRDKVIPAFLEHHKNLRSRELVSTTNELIQKFNLNPEATLQISKMVLSLSIRSYRSALALAPTQDNKEKRAYIFNGYNKIDKISKAQRLANTLVVSNEDIREWFQVVADRAILFLKEQESGEHV